VFYYIRLLILHIAILSITACGSSSDRVDSLDKKDNPTTDNNEFLDTDNDGVHDKLDIDIDGDGLIELYSLEQLSWIRHDLNGLSLNDGRTESTTGCPVSECRGYELMNNLDFDTNHNSVIDQADAFFNHDNDGENNGWLPIGNADIPFSAIFEGNHFFIDNLYINRPSNDPETNGSNIGLFGYLKDGEIRNLNLRKVSIKGDNAVGGLLGQALAYSENVIIDNCSVYGEVIGNTDTGNLLGSAFANWSNISITNNSSEGSVIGERSLGGLLGIARLSGNTSNLIISNNVTDNLVTASNSSAGGLVGALYGQGGNIKISNNGTTGSVSGNGEFNTGGLIGQLEHNGNVNLYRNSASGSVTSAGNYAGGLIGILLITSRRGETLLNENNSSGNVTSSGYAVGGLIGNLAVRSMESNMVLSNNYATGNVLGEGRYIGGLIGLINGGEDFNLFRNYATGSVTGNDEVGGLIGRLYVGDPATLSESYSTSTVLGNNSVGGLIGYLHCSDEFNLHDNFTNGSVTASSGAGGLIGSIDTYDNLLSIKGNLTTPLIIGKNESGTFIGQLDREVLFDSNYYSTTSTEELNAIGNLSGALSPGNDVTGFTIDELKCPTAANNTSCASSIIYNGWDSHLNIKDAPVWDFGKNNQLPGLKINGQIHRGTGIDTQIPLE
jgi:hypothetical protein